MASMQDMLMRSFDGSGSGQVLPLVTAYEAEQLIYQLQVTSLERVGDASFTRQHDAIQKLNLQAHLNAQQHSDEFVMEQLVSLDRLSVLVQELLVIEVWKQQLYPLLSDHLASSSVDSSVAYLPLYHETAVANLLEVVLYHPHACEAVDEDSLLELADWCMRKLAYLNSNAHAHAAAKERSLSETLALTPLQELEEKRAETDFAAATCGLTILRYLTDNITRLPLGVMSRLLSAHDAVMALLPLVDSPPWVRDRPGGKLEKFIDGRWQAVAPADRLKITQLDGQVWLSLINLLVEPACRAKYDMDGYRKGCVLRLQRHLHELLLDQLPVLRQLARVLDEITLGIDGSAASSASASSAAAAAAAAAAAGGGGGGPAAASRLILEQVPVLRESLLRGRDWPALAAQQRAKQFGAAAKSRTREELQSMMQSFELLCAIEEQREQQQQQQQPGGGVAAAAAAAGSTSGGGGGLVERGGADVAEVLQAAVRVVCSRQVHAGGLWEPWCEFTASVDAAKPPEPVSISTAAAGDTAPTAATSNTSSSSGGGGVTVHGRRFRLAAMQEGESRALPTQGKISVHLLGAVAEALLQLPEVPLGRADAAAAAGVPAGLWVTVGLLAADGFALQLRLRKADKPTERDRVAGGWYAYHPVGGALTVMSKPASSSSLLAATAAAPASTLLSGGGSAAAGRLKPQFLGEPVSQGLGTGAAAASGAAAAGKLKSKGAVIEVTGSSSSSSSPSSSSGSGSSSGKVMSAVVASASQRDTSLLKP